MNQRIEFRCTEDEKADVQAEADAEGLKLSALIRQRVLAPNSPAISPREVDGGHEVTGGRVVYDDQPSASPRVPTTALVPWLAGKTLLPDDSVARMIRNGLLIIDGAKCFDMVIPTARLQAGYVKFGSKFESKRGQL